MKPSTQIKHIGAKLKLARDNSGIGIMELERKTGLARNQIYSIETGSKNYTITSLILLAESLGMKVELTK